LSRGFEKVLERRIDQRLAVFFGNGATISLMLVFVDVSQYLKALYRLQGSEAVKENRTP